MKRIQRRRTKGWRMPEGAVYVGRPSQWGNPFDWRDPLIGDLTEQLGFPGGWPVARYSQRTSRTFTRRWGIQLTEGSIGGSLWMPTIGFIDIPLRPDITPLRGHDLACWCPLEGAVLSVACHADVLLKLANA